MATSLNRLSLIFTLFTISLVLLVAAIVTQGNTLQNLTHYPLDVAALLLLICVAFIGARLCIGWVFRGRSLLAGLWLFCFYLLAFGVMADGATADIEHSTHLIEKLALSLVYISLAIFSFFIPVLMLAISALQVFVLRWWFLRQARKQSAR
ncbi:hypothetical protein HGP28_08630 [Vibrio sp. SM6]|uniref:Uncharacterized protein n=1 Tax=Vibrio agarilyticus TaxID=2726741 RepID=A0A7X8YGS3_9VIBR|nr:hypothetical protein [Vibrio agarilyticus]NLS12954.1 hypothetical protein [Vibrio agarilyticus]